MSPRPPTRRSTRPASSTITPSATNPKLADNGWKTFFRALGNDATQGPAAAQVHQGHAQGRRSSSSSTTRPSTARAWPTSSARTSARPSSATTPSSRSRPTSAPPSPRSRSSGADALFFGGYSPEAAPLIKQLRDAGWKGTFVAADGVKDQSLHRQRRAGRRRRHRHLPLRPGRHRAGFLPAYKAKYNQDPNTYSGEGYDAATILLDGIAAGKDRASMIDFVKSYDKKGVTKQLKFDAKGESSDIKVFAYKVEGGKFIVRRRDQVARSSSFGAVGALRSDRPSCGDTGRCDPAHRTRPRRSWMQYLFDNFFALHHHGPDARRRLRARRARLHARLRRAAPDQLRPLRGVHVRHLRGACGSSCFLGGKRRQAASAA